MNLQINFDIVFSPQCFWLFTQQQNKNKQYFKVTFIYLHINICIHKILRFIHI